MAEPGTEKPKRGPGRPKKTPQGQQSIDFNAPTGNGKPSSTNRPRKPLTSAPPPQNPPKFNAGDNSGGSSFNARRTGPLNTQSGRVTNPGAPLILTPNGRGAQSYSYSSVNQDFNARGPRQGVRVSGGNTVTQPGAALAPTPKRLEPVIIPPRPPKPPVNGPDAFGPRRGSARYSTPPPLDRGIQLTGHVPKPPRGKGNVKARLGLGLLALATAGGVGYLASRSRENEVAAKPGPQAPEITVPGRNASPSSGNTTDRALYPEPSASNQPGLSERARNNQRANRNPDDYLGEAFDATVKRGRAVGRKHLQGMLVRDAVDSDTAQNLINRYDKEINSQSTLANYRDKGVTQEFDKANPGKAGKLLQEYRAMGRSSDAAPRGATLAELKARALK